MSKIKVRLQCLNCFGSTEKFAYGIQKLTKISKEQAEIVKMFEICNLTATIHLKKVIAVSSGGEPQTIRLIEIFVTKIPSRVGSNIKTVTTRPRPIMPA